MRRRESPKKCGAACAKGKKCKNSPASGSSRCWMHQSSSSFSGSDDVILYDETPLASPRFPPPRSPKKTSPKTKSSSPDEVVLWDVSPPTPPRSPKRASPGGSKAVVTKPKRSSPKKTSPFSTSPPSRKSPSPPHQQESFGFIDTPFGRMSLAPPDPYTEMLFSGTRWRTPESPSDSLEGFIVSDDEETGRSLARKAMGIVDSDLPLYKALVKLNKGKWKEFLKAPVVVQKFKEVRTIIEQKGRGGAQLNRKIQEIWNASWAGNLEVGELKKPKAGEICALCNYPRNLRFKYSYGDSVAYAGPDCNRIFKAMRNLTGYCKDAAAMTDYFKPGDGSYNRQMDEIDDAIQNYIDEIVYAYHKMKEDYEMGK